MIVLVAVVALPLLIIGLIEATGGDLGNGEGPRSGSPRRGKLFIAIGFAIVFADKVEQIGWEPAFLLFLKLAMIAGGVWCVNYAIFGEEIGRIRRVILGLVGIALFAAGWLIHPDEAKAGCPTRFINPVTDVCWQNRHPIKGVA